MEVQSFVYFGVSVELSAQLNGHTAFFCFVEKYMNGEVMIILGQPWDAVLHPAISTGASTVSAQASVRSPTSTNGTMLTNGVFHIKFYGVNVMDTTFCSTTAIIMSIGWLPNSNPTAGVESKKIYSPNLYE